MPLNVNVFFKYNFTGMDKQDLFLEDCCISDVAYEDRFITITAGDGTEYSIPFECILYWTAIEVEEE